MICPINKCPTCSAFLPGGSRMQPVCSNIGNVSGVRSELHRSCTIISKRQIGIYLDDIYIHSTYLLSPFSGRGWGGIWLKGWDVKFPRFWPPFFSVFFHSIFKYSPTFPKQTQMIPINRMVFRGTILNSTYGTYTQKPIYFAIFTNNIWSNLLYGPP